MQRRLGIGKRTKPVVRRHLAAPYIFLRLPRFPYPERGERETTNFPFLVAFRLHAQGFHSTKFYPNIVIVVSSCENLAEERKDSLRFDIFPIVLPMFISSKPIDATMALFCR